LKERISVHKPLERGKGKGIKGKKGEPTAAIHPSLLKQEGQKNTGDFSIPADGGRKMGLEGGGGRVLPYPRNSTRGKDGRDG